MDKTNEWRKIARLTHVAGFHILADAIEQLAPTIWQPPTPVAKPKRDYEAERIARLIDECLIRRARKTPRLALTQRPGEKKNFYNTGE